MRDYKNIKVWEKSFEFAVRIYKETESFPKSEMYGLTSQLRRGASSIPANIAEGCAKYSSKDFSRFLEIALGSAFETENHILLAQALEYLEPEVSKELLNNIDEIKKMTSKYIYSIKTNSD